MKIQVHLLSPGWRVKATRVDKIKVRLGLWPSGSSTASYSLMTNTTLMHGRAQSTILAIKVWSRSIRSTFEQLIHLTSRLGSTVTIRIHLWRYFRTPDTRSFMKTTVKTFIWWIQTLPVKQQLSLKRHKFKKALLSQTALILCSRLI